MIIVNRTRKAFGRFSSSMLLSVMSLLTLGGTATAQTSISPTTWGGTNTASSAPTNFSPLPASSVPGASAVSVSQWNRGPGIAYNAGSGRYNSKGWTTGSAGVNTAYSNGDYLYFTITNNASTQLVITAVGIGSGQKSGTGPSTFGLLYKIGTGSVTTFDASSAGPSPSFTGTAIHLCAGETITFYMCGWGGSSSSGTYSINSNASVTAQYVTAVSASAGSTSPVTAGTPLTFSGSGNDGISPYSYSWAGPLAYSSTEQNPTIAAPTTGESGTYTLTVTDAWGCSSQQTTDVTVNPGSTCSGTPDAGTASATTSSYCESGSTTVSVSGGSTASGITYQWYASTTSASGPFTMISGATTTLYNTPTLTTTTHYVCVATCTGSSLSDSSNTVTVTIHPLPTLSVSPTGGAICSAGSGLDMTASGASTYSWAPSTGLSTSTGSSVNANPTSTTSYTVTGTDANGCVSTAAVDVTYKPSPGTPSFTPSPATTCTADGPAMIVASATIPQTTTYASGSISVNFSHTSTGFVNAAISSIPTGATITGVSVKFSATQVSGGWNSDDIINLKAPNGNILNLVNAVGGSFSTSGFSNTVISSSATTSLPSSGGSYTGTYKASLALSKGASGYQSNVNSWSSLYTVPNGTWQVIGYYTYSSGYTRFTDVTLTIDYTYEAPKTWSPTTNLYTDAAGTTAYSGGTADTVYLASSTATANTYTVVATEDGCSSTATLNTTVNTSPATISGVTELCEGGTSTFTNATTSGTWTSSNANLTIDAGTGAATAVSAGDVTVTYTVSNGCYMTHAVTVNPLPATITGTMEVCESATTTLTSADAGGTWTSSNTNATINASTGVTTGSTAGTSVITYTLSTSCLNTATVTINPLPAAIAGGDDVCVSATMTLTNTSSGGTWSSSNSNAGIDASSGVVTGMTAGTSDIVYTLATGCMASKTITVNHLPPAIGGTATVCEGATTMLTNAETGGTWSTADANATVTGATGEVTGVTMGTASITYTLPTGCNTATEVTINEQPATIGGTTQVCEGFAIVLTNSTSGGTWTSDDIATATIDGTTGDVSGLVAGTATISYTLGNGCAATSVLTVNPVPAAISGTMELCEAGGTTNLGDATSGGSWSTSATSIATVDGSGTVSGVAAGNSDVSYTLSTGCYITTTVTVNSLPDVITGTAVVCASYTTTLTTTSTGGTWSAADATTATVDAGGIVTGVNTGMADVLYTLPTGCMRAANVTVNPLPATIAGTADVCEGNTTTLSDADGGGTWTSGNTAIATAATGTGVITGVSAGTAVISYTISTGCFNMATVTVNALPDAITGLMSVCEGQTITLMNTTSGGVWSSGSTAKATADLTTGTITGVSAGTSGITYALPTGCIAAATVTINSTPAAIAGSNEVCFSSTTLLSNTALGGSWTSTDAAVAPITSAGMVSGSATGTATISYTLPFTGCYATTEVTVHPLPAPATVTGGGSYCADSAGVSVGLSTSETGVNYDLIHVGTTLTTVGGSGSAFDFGTQTAAGTYTVLATNAITGCEANMPGSATVTILPMLTPAVSVTTTADTSCSGVSVTLNTATVNGGTSPSYTWSVNGTASGSGASFSYVPTDGDTVAVVMTTNAACPTVDTASGWRKLNVLLSATPTLTVASDPGDTICVHETLSLNASSTYGGASPVYTWRVNGSVVSTGNTYSYDPDNLDVITCQLSSSYLCRLMDEITSPAMTIHEFPEMIPAVTITADPDVVITEGQTVTLTATVTGGGPTPTYQWSVNGTDIPGATNSTYVSSSFTHNDEVKCTVTSSGVCGGFESFNVVHMTVQPSTGIAAQETGRNITLAPNPNAGTFTVTGLNNLHEAITLTVTSMTGREVYSKNLAATATPADATLTLDNSIANGMYLLHISTAGTHKTLHFAVTR